MYIDDKRAGYNPFWSAMDANAKGAGKLGQDASHYHNHDDYESLRKNENFVAAITAMNNADHAMVEAGKMIEKDGHRLHVGPKGMPRNFDELDPKEKAFLKLLAQARVELTEALEQFKLANQASNHLLSNNIVPWVDRSVTEFDKNLKDIDAAVLSKVEDLAADMQPQKRGKPAGKDSKPDYAAIADLLQSKFPGMNRGYYETVAVDVATVALGKSRSPTN